jgi:hypothetical protein
VLQALGTFGHNVLAGDADAARQSKQRVEELLGQCGTLGEFS